MTRKTFLEELEGRTSEEIANEVIWNEKYRNDPFGETNYINFCKRRWVLEEYIFKKKKEILEEIETITKHYLSYIIEEYQDDFVENKISFDALGFKDFCIYILRKAEQKSKQIIEKHLGK